MVEPTPSGDEVPEADLIEQHTPIEDTDATPAPTVPVVSSPLRWALAGRPTRPISWSKQSPSRCPRRTTPAPDSTADPHHRTLFQ